MRAEPEGPDRFHLVASAIAGRSLHVSAVQPPEAPSWTDGATIYVAAGADMIFPEAVTDLGMYRKFVDATKVPVLANITEFGQTPFFTVAQLRSAGVRLVLYPLSAFRAAARAQLQVYDAIRNQGTQQSVLELMQTRAELYDVLGYHEYEKKLDELFGKEKP